MFHALVPLGDYNAVIVDNILTYLMWSKKKTEPQKRKIFDEGNAWQNMDRRVLIYQDK